MPHLSNQDRAMIIEQLQRGISAREVAIAFNVNRRTVNRLKTKFEETDDVKNRPRNGCPRSTTAHKDRWMKTQAARERRISCDHTSFHMLGP